jgi:hypothetical protein
MLSSKRQLFQWGRRERMAELPLFRILRQRWRPTVRPLASDGEDGFARPPWTKDRGRPAGKSVWTPWLWIDPD